MGEKKSQCSSETNTKEILLVQRHYLNGINCLLSVKLSYTIHVEPLTVDTAINLPNPFPIDSKHADTANSSVSLCTLSGGPLPELNSCYIQGYSKFIYATFYYPK